MSSIYWTGAQWAASQGSLPVKRAPNCAHNSAPLLSIDGKRPPCAQCLLYALLFVCFHVFWKHQPFTPLLCDAWWYNDAGPQTGNNLDLSVCVCVFVSLCCCVCVITPACLYVWNNCANCCVKIALCWRETRDESRVICSGETRGACSLNLLLQKHRNENHFFSHFLFSDDKPVLKKCLCNRQKNLVHDLYAIRGD